MLSTFETHYARALPRSYVSKCTRTYHVIKVVDMSDVIWGHSKHLSDLQRMSITRAGHWDRDDRWPSRRLCPAT